MAEQVRKDTSMYAGMKIKGAAYGGKSKGVRSESRLEDELDEDDGCSPSEDSPSGTGNGFN